MSPDARRRDPRHGLRPPVVAVALLALVLAACGGQGGSAPSADASEHEQATGTVRLGYYANVTHAPAIVGVEEGLFQDALGDGVTFETRAFRAGGEAVEALWSGAVDAAYVGANPAINGYVRSGGEALRIVAGSTSGGAFLVTRPELTSPDQLAGARLATPALGNTQDVALRAWLAEQGFATTLEGGGDVAVQPLDNAQILEAFRDGQIDGAWVPEPWATRLLEEAGGRVLVDERDLWPHTHGEYVTANLVVTSEFLAERPDLVERLLVGHLDALARMDTEPATLAAVVADGIAELTGTAQDPRVVELALANLTFTPDPIADALQGAADDAVAIGVLDAVDLAGIHDLTILDRLLADRGEPGVSP